jgi:hypothetical protein
MRTIDDMGSGTGGALAEQVDVHLGEPYGAVPRGRKGLFRALAGSVAPAAPGRALPDTDAAGIGAVGSMFDYDPSQATELMTD